MVGNCAFGDAQFVGNHLKGGFVVAVFFEEFFGASKNFRFEVAGGWFFLCVVHENSITDGLVGCQLYTKCGLDRIFWVNLHKFGKITIQIYSCIVKCFHVALDMSQITRRNLFMLRILTDTSAGFTYEDVKKIGVEMVSLSITFEDGEYLDGKNLSTDEFYAKQKVSKTLPKTAAVNQEAFEEVFRDVKAKGDEMIVLTISKELSLTHDQAMKAKKAVGYDKIYIIDTLSAATPIIALLMEAVKMRDAKMSTDKIVAEISALVPKARLFAYVDTLKYLKAGGRISGMKAFMGTILGVKPILTLVDGKIASNSKAMGLKKAQEAILEQLKTHDVDFSRPVYFAHTNAHEECEKIKARARERHEFKDGGTWYISATVAVHAGPGASAVAFFVK